MAESENVSLPTVVAQRAVEWRDDVVERLREELAVLAGREAVGPRELRNRVLEAAGGSVAAMGQIEELLRLNGHRDGEQAPCPLCAVINYVLLDVQGGK